MGRFLMPIKAIAMPLKLCSSSMPRFAVTLACVIVAACGQSGNTAGTTSAGGVNGVGAAGAGAGLGGASNGGAAGSGAVGTGGATGSGAVAGSGASAGTGAVGGAGQGGAAGSTGGSGAGTAGSAGGLSASCSETELRTGPPPGKEMFQAEPVDATFPFSVHWMGTLDDPTYISMTSLTDIDNDGDLDFASGQRHGQANSTMQWWEYCTPDHWVRHTVGTGHRSAAGGYAMDVNADGWIDLLAGDSWYRNPGEPQAATEWERFFTGAPEAEELIASDVTGDNQSEVLFVWRSIDPQFWAPGPDPTEEWLSTTLSGNRQQQGGAIGDMDGDGDNDIVVGYRWWYRNNGDGTQWETVEIFGNQYDQPYDAPLAYIGDMDGDGDSDIVICAHFGEEVAWLENLDGDATSFEFHELATDLQFLHAIVAADFDNDADLDIFVGQNVGPSFIFENTDGNGSFEQRQIADDVRMHEARVGDVDCDGDLDIAGKPWGDPGEGGEAQLTETRDHIYLQNMLVENGGPARFDRGPYEEQHSMVGNRLACP